MDRRQENRVSRNRVPVLVIEPDRALGPTLVEVLRRGGFQAEWKATYPAGREALQGRCFALVYLGIHGPSREGLRVLREVRALRPEAQIVVGALRPGVGMAVEATHLGAYRFLERPFRAELLVQCFLQALEACPVRDRTEEEEILRRIGQSIRQIRRHKGLTLRQVGRRSGLSSSMISKVELGDCNPPVTTLIRIARALDADLQDLIPRMPRIRPLPPSRGLPGSRG